MIKAGKTPAILLLGGIALCMAPGAAMAKTQGWYLGLGGGWSTLGTIRTDLGPPAGPATGKIQFGDTFAVDLSGGYKFDFPLRTELEIRYADFNASNLVLGAAPTITLQGDAAATSIFLNALYDIPVARHFSITLGAGIGAAQFDPSITDLAGDRIFSSQTVLTWQGIAGLTVALNDRFDVQLDYRYQGLRDTDHSFVAGATSPLTMQSKTIHSVMLGVRWYLEDRLPPPAPTPYIPPPPPPPPPPMAVKTFLVFFDFNKSDVGPDAQNVIASAVDEARRAGMVRVVVTGHTDTVGSSAYNDELSVRRAESVKRQMVSDGMPESEIVTVGKGFSEPLVQTGPGVREPQNRRAVIDIRGGPSS